jgi:DNA adenine methylase
MGHRTPSGGFFTPLRYPGGKGKLASYVANVIRLNDLVGGTYVEPYAGGAGVALELLLTGVVRRIHINDLNPSVHAFWEAVLFDTDRLCSRIRQARVSMTTWRIQRDILAAEDPDPLDLAFATFFLNRTNRSGILEAGVIGGQNQDGLYKIDARFNKSNLIDRIESIALQKSRIRLYNEDAERLVRRLAPSLGTKCLLYFDPPYFVKGQDLYLNHYQPKDHMHIQRTIAALPKHLYWMVSYDNHPEIAKLYRKFDQLTYSLNYTAQMRYRGSEIIMFSKNLTPPAPVRPMQHTRFISGRRAA